MEKNQQEPIAKQADRAKTGQADVQVSLAPTPVFVPTEKADAPERVAPSAPAYGLGMEKDIEAWRAAGVLSDSRMVVVRAVDAFMKENKLTQQDVQGWPVIGEEAMAHA